jgi:hypothetical protein
MISRYFEINGQLLRVTSSDRDLLDSLGSFFYPYITSHDETFAAGQYFEVSASVDEKLFAHLKANLPDSPDELVTTNLKHDAEYQLRCFFSESGETVIEDEPLKLFYVTCGPQRTTLIGAPGSRMRTGLLRLLRAAWMTNQNGLIVHSSVIEKDEQGVVIVGDKYAGKTTSLLKLCTQKHYNLVANDRCLVSFDEASGPRALGVPTVINLRPETIRPFPQLRFLQTLELHGVYDLARALKIDIKPEVPVAVIVFLGYDRASSHPSYRRLSGEEIAKMLSSHLFSGREYDWVNLLKLGGVPAKGDSVSLSGISGFQLISNENQLDERANLIDGWRKNWEKLN